MLDPLVHLANQRIVKVSADLEFQLSKINGSGPTLLILDRLRTKAAQSLAGLAIVDAEDVKAVRTLQNEVKRYDEWIGEMAAIIAEGKTLDQQTSAQDRDDLLDMLSQTPEGQQEAIELGLVDDLRTD